MADFQIQATINLPAFGLKWGETGTVDSDHPALAGTLAAGHAIRLGGSSRRTAEPAPEPAPATEG